MKRPFFLYYLFSSILFVTINSLCVVNTQNIQPKVLLSSSFSCCKEFPQSSWSKEGFCGDIFVKTDVGYKPIQECKEGDILVGCYDQEKKIVSITKKFVKQYVHLVVDDIIMNVGCDQQYCILPEHTWKPAKNIKAGDQLLTNSRECCTVTDAQLIGRETLLYSFTIEDHIFYIAPGDICVHNAEALTLGIAAVCLEYITLVNPIIATIGATAALFTIIYKACSDQEQTVPTSALLPERSYYEQRKVDLYNIRQELLCIKNDLVNIKALCGNGSFSFTHQFLQQNDIVQSYCQNQLSKISPADEMQLHALEQDIIALQCMLALHCNTVIEQFNAAVDEYRVVRDQARVTKTAWNNSVHLTDSIALQLYKAELIEDFVLCNLNQKITELEIIVQYYRNCMSTCLKESTNIVDFLATIDPFITEWHQTFQEDKKRVVYNMSLGEQYFARRGISVANIKNETRSVLEQAQKNNAIKMLAQIQNKLSNMVSSGGPYKDPKKDDEPEVKQNCAKIEIYEKNARHIFRDEIGHLPDTSANRELLIDMVSDKKNFLGTCKFGNEWYSKTLKNGQQVWASVRNGFIRNGGLNNIVREFNFETGLANMKG
jgi:hypothetical protein